MDKTSQHPDGLEELAYESAECPSFDKKTGSSLWLQFDSLNTATRQAGKNLKGTECDGGASTAESPTKANNTAKKQKNQNDPRTTLFSERKNRHQKSHDTVPLKRTSVGIIGQGSYQ